jgi:hypothetical protein
MLKAGIAKLLVGTEEVQRGPHHHCLVVAHYYEIAVYETVDHRH